MNDAYQFRQHLRKYMYHIGLDVELKLREKQQYFEVEVEICHYILKMNNLIDNWNNINMRDTVRD